MNFTIHLLLMSNNISSISADTSKEILIKFPLCNKKIHLKELHECNN